jgi:Dolichyl-phosphate-mannose-protein mannosyltransferase
MRSLRQPRLEPQERTAMDTTTNFLPALYTALTVGLVYLLAISLGGVGIGAWLAAISYGFGTIALVYTRDFYADPLLALLVAYGLLITFRKHTSWTIVVVTALAVLAKPTGIILGPALSVYLLWRERRYLLSLLPSLGSAIGLAIYFFYNQYRFGDFRTFRQPWKFSLGHIPGGLAGLSVSPGGGLLWFCPCVVLPFLVLARTKTRRAEMWTIVALVGSSMLVHSFWHAWNGDGPGDHDCCCRCFRVLWL